MKGPIRIFLSFNSADADIAQGLAKHLRQAMAGTELIFWNPEKTATELLRKDAGQFLERANLYIPVLSVHFLDDPDARWALQKAVSEAQRRNAFRILVALGRHAFTPDVLVGFPISPGQHDPIEHESLKPDRQLMRVAEAARNLLAAAPSSPTQTVIKLPFGLSDAKERLFPLLDRVDFKPIFDILKVIAYDAALIKSLFEAEDAFSNLIQQTRGLKTDLDEFLAKKAHYKNNLERIIEFLRDEDLIHQWEKAFIALHFSFQKRGGETIEPYFFIPTEDIAIPETLHLPGARGAAMSAENVGILSYQQKLDFRRSLLLAQDAIAIENFARAHAHCEHVRSHIDPESAQLYEYLLITYLHKEKSEHIVAEALRGEGRMLNHVTLFAGRLRLYNDEGKCTTRLGAYNRRVAAEILSDGMCNVYNSWSNDYILDTGRRAEQAPDHKDEARRFIEAAQLVYRAVHPMRGALRVLINELCGGGKFHWVSRIVFADDDIRLLSDERFDLESQISELIGLVEDVDAGQPDKQYQQRVLLRENLYFALLAKRQLLARQIAEEVRSNQRSTDPYESVIRYIQACLLGQQIFGDASQDGKDQSFLRLALEYLLPSLVLDPDADALLPELRWFDLDAKGNLVAHPDRKLYKFDARAILEKIVRDHAGKAGWMQVSPNIKEEVFKQHVADTDAMYEEVHTGLSWQDIRRMNTVEARKRLIVCLRRWMIAYHAYPEQGQRYLDYILRELVALKPTHPDSKIEEHENAGTLQLWLYHDPYELATHPDSVAYGYDARAELRIVLGYSTRYTENDLRQNIAEHLFQHRILPAYEAVKKGDEQQRSFLIRLLMEALAGFRLYPDPRYLDFVYKELTAEHKFPWIDINIKGEAFGWAFISDYPFDPLEVLDSIHLRVPERYKPYAVRERIARNRHRDLTERYFHEISEYKQENRRPEREIVVDIIRKMKGIYRYFPKAEFLELVHQELSNRGRIRWHAQFLGLIPARDNHFENHFYDFDYRYEMFECKRLLDQEYEMLKGVMKETGELEDLEEMH